MRITVNVPDRIISVDGLIAPISGAVPDDSVRTIQYDTQVLEGLVEYIDRRHEPVRNPALVAPWVSLWGHSLNARVDAATRDGAETDERYTAWLKGESARVAEREAVQAQHQAQADAAAAKAKEEEEARIDAKVRAIISELAAKKG